MITFVGGRWSVFHEYYFHAPIGAFDLISNSIFLKNAYASINHLKSRCHFRFFRGVPGADYRVQKILRIF